MNRILIAEDEVRLAAFLEKGLQKYGFVTAVAEDGQQALEMAKTGNFELLLLDLRLPLKDGWKVLEELRSQGQKFPIIVVTALNDEGTRHAVLLKGANDYLTKPFKFKDLLTRVQSFLVSN
ncbi:response regulator receiver protein [Stanieria cyanosphaera PCC 7437]|uniref:Response regulator receiver protein n=1 Tax=Stanieria cyanosphaera (strain ATCC 29371 / PCC 7437) TaxID=111780 RepID=K9XR86_STAC7|nr:response regulator [Stanieria cyanosphaera]AFZ35125.1 response regulator receiver protein [Stanieria cyanosphaera PCC 7437]